MRAGRHDGPSPPGGGLGAVVRELRGVGPPESSARRRRGSQGCGSPSLGCPRTPRRPRMGGRRGPPRRSHGLLNAVPKRGLPPFVIADKLELRRSTSLRNQAWLRGGRAHSKSARHAPIRQLALDHRGHLLCAGRWSQAPDSPPRSLLPPDHDPHLQLLRPFPPISADSSWKPDAAGSATVALPIGRPAATITADSRAVNVGGQLPPR